MLRRADNEPVAADGDVASRRRSSQARQINRVLSVPAPKQFMAMREMEIDGLGKVTPGVRVRHPVFGPGEITLLAQWASGEKTVRVEFADYGSKMLAPEFAKLTRV